MGFEGLVPSIQYVVDRHSMPAWHLDGYTEDFHNFMLIVSGKVYMAFNQEDEYVTVGGGNLIYCPKGSYRKAYTDAYEPMHCYAVNFDYVFCDQKQTGWALNTSGKPLPFDPIIAVRNMESLVALFKELNEEWMGKKLNYRLKCRVLMMEILYRLLRENRVSKENEAKARKVETAMDYIARHYRDPLSLGDMASAVDLSPVYFGSIFKEVSGFTPKEYHHFVRVNKARDLLLSGGYTVGEVAELVGYRDIYYFSRMFKRITGKNPSEYKY